ncbi:hypothetical protein KAU19_00920, partial [Candidatus Parcubacteria bacterium]|nr:hypothetical protein [Candidatus Parcubacteria bacterium]
LIKKISEGAMQVEYNGVNNEKYQKDIEVIGVFLKKQDKEISDAQKKYLRDQTIRGAVISAGFATAGYAIRHFAGELFGWDKELGVVKKEISEKEAKPEVFRDKFLKQQSGKDITVKPLLKETAKYDPSRKIDLFNTEFKKSVEAASKQAETESVAAAAVKQAESVKNIDIKIEGKIDTFSEAIYEAAKQADSKTQDNFIHKVLGNEEVIDDSNRGKFLSQTVRELSVANIETGDDLDVKNLVHEGNIVRLKNDGSWEVLKGQGAADAEAVSELQLRKNWADAEGAKHGFKPEEVNFADNEHLDDRSFKTEVNGVEVIVDNQGHFSGEVGGKEFSGDISGLEEGQTAKGAISETIDNAKEEVEKAVDTKKIAAKAVKTEVAPEKISNETRGKLIHDFFGGVGLAHDDVEKINEIVNLEDGIQHSEEPLLKFLAEHRELINEPKFFEFSEKTGIEYDKPHFLKIYNTMPDDIKKIDMRAEGFMEAFAGPKVQMSSGLKKLFGFTADPSWKIRVDGTKIIENAYGKKGFNILVTENNITVEKSRLLFGTKKLFSGDFSLNNIGKVKNKIFGITE